MSKTSQELKKKKLAVEAPKSAGQKAPETTENIQKDTVPTPESESSKTVKKARVRGKKYQDARKKIDVLKLYPLKDAVKLVKETSLSKFDGKVEAHLTVMDIGSLGEISFPHLETTAKKIVIVDDKILADLKTGKINFDVLIATPTTMPKLLPFARLLGPRGLMPNPKTGTLTDKPEEAVKKLAIAKTSVKTEKKAPLVHIIVGRVSQPEAELTANVTELIKVIKAPKIKKLSLCATMGPSVKVAIEK